MHDNKSSPRRLGAIAAHIVFALALIVFWQSLLTGSILREGDAVENLQAAISFERSGVISDRAEAPFSPSMQREPLPAVVGAAAVRVADAVLGQAEPQAYLSGERLVILKWQNILWLLVLSASVFGVARLMGLSHYLSLLCVALNSLLLLNSEVRIYMLDSLCTEAPAAALLALGSLLLAAGMTRGKILLVGLGGVTLGLLTLVKAAFLYIAFGTAAAVFCLCLLQRRSFVSSLGSAVVLCASFAIVVTPWMYRNHENFGTFSLARRGGEILYSRGLIDSKMTADEYAGGLYLWAPYPLDAVLRRAFGFSRTDLQRGGRVQHLNEWIGSDFSADDQAAEEAGRPQDAINYFKQGAAEHVRLAQELRRQGDPDPESTADKQLTARGIELIRAHPWKHAALMFLYTWRGAFFAFPPLFIAFVWSLRRGRFEVTLLAVPALGMIAFYAFVSYFMPRYGLPAAPMAVCAAVALCAAFYTRVRHG
jgi:hypothetical protein